jgi:hypothetical protein
VTINRVFAIVSILILGLGMGAFSKAFGEWDTTIVISPEAGSLSLAGSRSTLKASYFAGEVADISNRALSSLFITDKGLADTGMGVQAFFNLPLVAGKSPSTFRISTYLKDDIVIDWPIGTWTLLSDTSFSVTTASLQYGWMECIIAAYGTKISGAFLLIPTQTGHTLGAELALQGTTIAGMALEAVTTLGVGANMSEATKAPPTADTCFCYTGTDISLSGLALGCVHYEDLTRFSEGGFEFTRFEFEIDLPEDWPLSLYATLEFTTQTKSLVLVPSLRVLDLGCMYLYVGIDVAALTLGETTIGAIKLAGLRLADIDIGPATVSGVVAFDGVLWKGGREDDISLRAANYLVCIAADCNPADYREVPTKYDMGVSLETSEGNLDAAVDAYFRPTGGGSLFGLALFTGEVRYMLTSEIEFGIGLAINPLTGWERLTMDLTISLYL